MMIEHYLQKSRFLLILILCVFLALVPVFTGCGDKGRAESVTDETIVPDEPMPDPSEIDSPVYSEHSFTVEDLTSELQDDPNRPDLLFQLLLAKMDMGDYNGALELLEPLDELGDKLWSSQGHMIAGKIIREKLLPVADDEMRVELQQRAVRQFEISLEIDPSPSNLATYWYLGDIQHQLGDIEGAKENLSIYLLLQPYSYDIRLKLAEIYLEEGSLERAVILLDGMKTDPNEERRERALELMPE